MSYIRVHSGNDLIQQLELGKERITIGRTADNSIVLADANVSRQHAAIEYQDGDYFLVDLGSQNGVFVNNGKVKRQKLKYWDEIQIHSFVIKFMAKPGLGENKQDQDEAAPAHLESDKTTFFDITDAEQLDDLRQKTKQCYLSYNEATGETRKLLIEKPRIIIGKSKQADVKVGGWFAPKIAAIIERQGNSYELVPTKRGQVNLESQPISASLKLRDGNKFSVRDIEFTFYNRLTD